MNTVRLKVPEEWDAAAFYNLATTEPFSDCQNAGVGQVDPGRQTISVFTGLNAQRLKDWANGQGYEVIS